MLSKAPEKSEILFHRHYVFETWASARLHTSDMSRRSSYNEYPHVLVCINFDLGTTSEGAQNPLQAMQHVGYREGSLDMPFQTHHHQQQQVRRQASPAAKEGCSPDAIAKSPTVSATHTQPPEGNPMTNRGHAVQVGVVSKPFNLPQQDTSPPGQVNVRTIFCYSVTR